MSDERVHLRFESFQAFLDECAERVSEEGIFLATSTPASVGSVVDFEIGLSDDFPILRGSGEVVRVESGNGAREPEGVALRYREPDAAMLAVARRVVERQRARSGRVFDLEAAPAAVGDEAPALGSPDMPKIDQPPTVGELEMPKLDEVPPEQAPSEAGAEPALASATAEATQPWQVESEPRRSGRAFWMALALVVVAAGAAYLQRDALRELFAGATADDTATAAPEPATADVDQPESVDADALEPDLDSSSTEPVAAPVDLGPVTRVERISWSANEGETVLELVTDGAIAGGYGLERLNDPPRLLIMISGVSAPLARPNLAVGSSEVVGVRTGLHGTPPDSRLHVVVDLADPTAQAGDVRIDGARLQVPIVSGAVSP